MTNIELARLLADTSRADLVLGSYKIPVHIDSVDANSFTYTPVDISIKCSVMDTIPDKYVRYDVQSTIAFLNRRKNEANPFQIKDVIFNNPATIVIWADGTKTVVKCTNEEFDPEKGLSMAIAKKALGNKGNYYETFKKFVKE